MTGRDYYFFLYVLFLYKIEINRKSLFILSEKILIFQVKVFFLPSNQTYGFAYFLSNLWEKKQNIF